MIRILIAEDDPLIGSFLERGFSIQGIATLLVDDGEQAVMVGTAEDFDLMILDMTQVISTATGLAMRGSCS